MGELARGVLVTEQEEERDRVREVARVLPPRRHPPRQRLQHHRAPQHLPRLLLRRRRCSRRLALGPLQLLQPPPLLLRRVLSLAC